MNWAGGSAVSTVSLGAGVTTFSGLVHTYLDNRPGDAGYSIQVTVTDSAGGSATAATSATITNVAPGNLGVSLDHSSIDENGTVTLAGSFTDAGTLDTHVIDVNWGDGSSDSVLNLAAGVVSFSGVTHRYLDNQAGDAPYTITVTATDKDGASATASVQVAVANVGPTALGLTQDHATIDENGTVTLAGGFTDPGSLDTHVVDVNWADGSSDTVLNLAAGVVSFSGISHQYLDNQAADAPYSIEVFVTDKDGAIDVANANLTVTNVAPAVAAPADRYAGVGDVTTFALGSLADPGSQDSPWSVDVSWGDGSSHTTFNLSVPGALGSQDHVYADVGTYTVALQVTDKDGATGEATFQVTVVIPGPPQVDNPSDQSNAEAEQVALQVTATDPLHSPLTYTVSGLPAGLSIDAATGLISGTIDYSAADHKRRAAAEHSAQGSRAARIRQ